MLHRAAQPASSRRCGQDLSVHCRTDCLERVVAEYFQARQLGASGQFLPPKRQNRPSPIQTDSDVQQDTPYHPSGRSRPRLPAGDGGAREGIANP